MVERTLDNTLSLVAGVAAIGAALFPTGRGTGSGPAPTVAAPPRRGDGEDGPLRLRGVSALVFGASWLTKGLELDVLVGLRRSATVAT